MSLHVVVKIGCVTKCLVSISLLSPEWEWEKLPNSYQQSPYLNIDVKAIAISAYVQAKDDKTPLHPIILSQPSSPAVHCEAREAVFDELPSKVSIFNYFIFL